MNCPYCTEEIKKEVVICPHCHSDISLFKPILLKLKNLDCQLRRLKQSIDVRPADTAEATIYRASLATVLSIALAAITCWITWHYPFAPQTLTNLFDKPLNFLSVGAPFFAALWFSRSVPRLRSPAYLLLGLVPGFFGFAAWFFQHLQFRYHNHITPLLHPDWPVNVFVYTLSGPFWFLGGALLGSWLRTLNSPRTSEDSDCVDEPLAPASMELKVALIGASAVVIAALISGGKK